MKIFRGTRDERGVALVTIEDVVGVSLLPLRFDLTDHFPVAPEWGDGGVGSAQLALAILAAIFDDETAVRLCHALKWDLIARLDRDKTWLLSERDVRQWHNLATTGELLD